jgi:hypothetical protein
VVKFVRSESTTAEAGEIFPPAALPSIPHRTYLRLIHRTGSTRRKINTYNRTTSLLSVVVSRPAAGAVAVGVVGVVLEVAHPDTNKDTTTSERTNIAVIGFNCIRLFKW